MITLFASIGSCRIKHVPTESQLNDLRTVQISVLMIIFSEATLMIKKIYSNIPESVEGLESAAIPEVGAISSDVPICFLR